MYTIMLCQILVQMVKGNKMYCISSNYFRMEFQGQFSSLRNKTIINVDKFTVWKLTCQTFLDKFSSSPLLGFAKDFRKDLFLGLISRRGLT